MADDLATAQNDLAFLRRLTEDSRPLFRPLGAMLAVAGFIQSLSAMRFWAVANGLVDWPIGLRPFMGLDGVIVQIIATIWLAQGMTVTSRSASPSVRAVRGAINALAWALGTAALGFAAAYWRDADAAALLTGFLVVLFTLASATWQVVYAVYRHSWALWAAIASALFALCIGLSAGWHGGALVLAAGLLSCLGLPGLAMMREARAG